ncbi:hypothetical protein V6Z11_A10G288600 [Gossypium hirsutum]
MNLKFTNLHKQMTLLSSIKRLFSLIWRTCTFRIVIR